MGTKINMFGTTKLTLAAHAQFNELVAGQIAASDLEALHLTVLAPQYLAVVAAEKEAVNRPSAYAETPQMIAVDRLRDLSVSLVFNLIDAYLKSPSTAEQLAAEHLHAVVAPYRGIQKHEYNRQTTEVDGLIASISAAAIADLTLLSLTSAVEQMDAHNAAFKALLAERTVDVGTRAPVANESTGTLRRTTDTLYRTLVETVNAFAIAIPSAAIETFAVSINALITQYEMVAANQGKKQTTVVQ